MLFFPFFIFVLIFLLELSTEQVAGSKLAAHLTIFLFVMIPVFIVYYLRLMKDNKLLVPSISLDRRDRFYVYTIAVFGFTGAGFVLQVIESPLTTLTILFSIFFAAMFLINEYLDKVSMHSASCTFLVFFLTFHYYIEAAVLIILLPVIFWSRMALRRHTLLQLVLGVVVGATMGLLSLAV